MEQYDGAEAFIEVLNANGVEHIFFNPGGDLAPVQAAVLKYKAMGKLAPRLIMCLHESVALTAAHGHYMVSGRPQVVMVHSELGTQQVAGALHNAQWGRIPVILWAGLAAAPSRVNWRQEPYDQGAMVRNCVKWDHEISPDEDIHDLLQHAFNLALTEPYGPVYLSYSRDVLRNRIDCRKPESYMSSVDSIPPVDHQTLGKLADTLLAAKNPLIVAGYTARHPESVKNLIELAETLSSPVVTGLTRMNFPTTHPLCAGMEEMGGASKPNIPFTEADVLLAIDYDLPYVPAQGFPQPDATILHIDADPMTQGRPLWGRGADIFVKADSREAIPALSRIIKERITAERADQLRERFRQLEDKHKRQRKERHQMAISKSDEKPISSDWLCRCIAEILDDDMILVNHLISQASSVAGQIDRSRPGTLLGCAGGSIMWALGAALGAKVAAPDKTVVSLMTDGGFVWGCPVSALWTANSYKATFLSVIFNNQSYGAIRRILETMSETGLSDEMGFTAGIDISPPPDYALVAQACGGYGRAVVEPSDVLPVLREAIEEVRGGKLAVVDVRLPKG
ncbi:MAG: thiamine pyrophosphate-requiring protein [Dehalococcoidales bacterium]